MTNTIDIYQRLQDKILLLPMNEFLIGDDGQEQLRSQRIDKLILDETENLEEDAKKRIRAEFHGLGPIDKLIADEEISEILVNGPSSIWFEKAGRLQQCQDRYYSDLSFRNAVERLCQQARTHVTVAHPTVDAQWGDFRVALVSGELTRTATHFSLRRHPKNPWSFEKLMNLNWCQPEELETIKAIVESRKSFLIIGSTGAGKTSVLNSCLALLPTHERVVTIEDTPEISLANEASMKLITRQDPQQILPSIDQAQLVKRSLRLRPDRIVMGEVRGEEAKDFLMALATGHSGSFGTLHANSAHQALLRLEMLIQMGAPQWNLLAIRRLIHLSLDYIIVAGREMSGQRRLKGIYKISSLEEHGFLTEQVLAPQEVHR